MSRTSPRRAARLAELRAQASQLRARHVAARRQRGEARARRRPREQEGAGKRRGCLLLLLLLLLAVCCGLWRCDPPPEPAPPEVPVEDAPGEPVPPEPTEPTDRIDRRDRPAFEPAPAKPPSWVDAYRMQVAARGPRLAACFVGVDRPGTLKWSASVEPASGRVSDHELEPMLLSDELSSRERACLIEVLEAPPYQLDAGAEKATPSRVGIVIEF